MGRGPKPPKGKAKPATPRKSAKHEDTRVRDLEKRLAEALAQVKTRDSELAEAREQQAATGEILQVISRSPTDTQPVFEAICRSAVRLFDAYGGLITRFDGQLMHLAAVVGGNAEAQERYRRLFPRAPDREMLIGRAILDRTVVHIADVEQAESRRVRETGRDFGFRRGLIVPLLREGEAIGTLNVTGREPGLYSDRQVALLQTFADQAVIAIENVRLFKELEAKNRELTTALDQQTATSEILRSISSSLSEVQPVFDTIVQSGMRLLGGFSASMTLLRDDQFDLVAYTSTGIEGDISLRHLFPTSLRSMPPGERAVRERRTYAIEDIETASDVTNAMRATIRARGWRSALFVPMLRDNSVVGLIVVTRRDPGPFAHDETALLETFAAQAVIAIENVRLFTELQASNLDLTQALEQQTATSEILRVISQSPTDVQPVFDAIADSAARLCESFDSAVWRREGDRLFLVAHHGAIPQTGSEAFLPLVRGTVGGRSVLEARPVHITDVQTEGDDFPESSKNARRQGFRTILSVPLMQEGVAIGAIVLRRAEARLFSVRQVALLQTFADQAVIAIENVRLFNELQEKNHALTQAHAQVTKALEQQTATSEILRVISSSPTDLQPVAQAIADSARRLCDCEYVGVFRFDGELIHWVAARGASPEQEDALRSVWPSPPGPDTLTGRTILARATYYVHDAKSDAAYVGASTRDSLHAAVHATLAIRSFLGVPLLRDGEPTGVITLIRSTVRPFSEQEIALVQTFADQAVIAIENVRLFKELEARNRDLTTALDQQTATSEILSVISRSTTDVQPVFEAIAENARRLCSGVFSAVLRYDGELLHLEAHNMPSEAADAYRAVFPMSPTRGSAGGRAVLDCAVAHIPDIEADPEWGGLVAEGARRLGYRSILAVPMLRDGQVVGTINVARFDPGPFSERQVELLKTFADQAVIAIENVRLFKELQARTVALSRSVGQLTALGDVGRAVSSTLDLDTVLTTIVSRAVQLAEMDAGAIYEYDDAAEVFRLRATQNLPEEFLGIARPMAIRKGEGATGRLAVTREPVQVPDITPPDAYQSRLRDVLLRLGHRAVLAVPLLAENRIVGSLIVTRARPGDFPPEMIDLLKTFATQSALALQNARLFREIADKSRQLEAASQHKSEFLANMSHELRTPLNAIIGFSEVLSDRMFGELNEKQEEYLKDINASGGHLLSLINDILDLSKIEAGRMELELTDFDLPTALDNALTLVRERAQRRSLTLNKAVDAGVGQIQGDERKIRQVVLNLLSNAIKFTPEGGRIEVVATPKDGSVEVSVSDTGIGIGPEDQEKVFEEFRQVGTADKKAEGTGLGLTLCRKFIELHGGKIWVKSQLGAGSTFTFTIPMRPGE